MKPIFDPDMRLSEHFKLSEFLASDKAEKLHIPNTPLKCHIMRLQNLAVRCLEPIRQALGLPIHVNSGYRCPALNDAVKGVKNSQHMLGETADITILMSNRPFGHSTDEQIARLIFNYAKEYADFDQLILEHYTDKKTGRQHWWVHISCRIDYRQNRHEKLKIENGKSKKID